jgi:hypothetical protein
MFLIYYTKILIILVQVLTEKSEVDLDSSLRREKPIYSTQKLHCFEEQSCFVRVK